MPLNVDPNRLKRCYARARELLLAQRTPEHHWVGELSTSALSTATAVMALHQVRKAAGEDRGFGRQESETRKPHSPLDQPSLDSLIARGVQWLVEHQNADGGWGDTVLSVSNISTTMLCHAVLVAAGGPGLSVQCPEPEMDSGSRIQEAGTSAPTTPGDQRSTLSPQPPRDSALGSAQAYINRAGGVPALIARYGKDKTFSVPILTHCALAGLVNWRDITPLPFELACLPARFYKTVRLPVVSYALPALIAIGQVRHHFAPTRNPISRFLRNRAIEPSLRVLERIQPVNGGFLEATPLTSFVTMSLAAMGRIDHPVVRKGVEFIAQSVRPDGSWPIDTNLATWVTTLAVNALGEDLPEESRLPILNWLLDQQYQEVHPYTNADPGGWAWTNLPGGVPDADDTPGAILALLQLSRVSSVQCPASQPPSPTIAKDGTKRNADVELENRVDRAVESGVNWLLSLQNRDGGFPTFCRGWGTLPFDRSSPDITAHCLRAIGATIDRGAVGQMIQTGQIDAGHSSPDPQAARRLLRRLRLGADFLMHAQRRDGSWLPLWFGNQRATDDINPTYGTAKILHAYQHFQANENRWAQRGLEWLRSNQNPDGGWGAGPGTPSSVEETSLAVEALLSDSRAAEQVSRGLEWLMERVEAVDAVPPGSGDSGTGDAGTLSMPSVRERSGARGESGSVILCPRTPTPLPRDAVGTGRTCSAGERGFDVAPRTVLDPAPIGFYFAKLWYFERLYPLIFAVSCLKKSVETNGERRA